MDDVLFDLGEDKAVKPKIKPKIYTSGGKGKKQCQNTDCGVFVGVRTKLCPICGTEFVKKAPQKAALNPAKDAESETDSHYCPRTIVKTSRPYDAIVLIPSGLCPIVPTKDDLTEEGIILWAEAVRDWGLSEKKDYLTGRAILYYARHTFNIFSDEYKQIRSVLTVWEEGTSEVR